MIQLIIPGFEEYADFDNAIFDSESLIGYLYEKGYSWLTDFMSEGEDGPYIPYRIKFPSGQILDEGELFGSFKDLEKKGFSKEEIGKGQLLYYAINHEDTNKDQYKFCNHTFVSDVDRINSIKKYKATPFY